MHRFPVDERWKLPEAPEREDVLALLRAQAPKVSTCYVLSESASLDGRILPVDQALDAVLAVTDNTLLSFVPGRLAFFEGEGLRQRFVLRRSG